MNLSLALGKGFALPSLGHTAVIATVGLFGYGISLIFFVLGLRHLGTARTGAYYSLAPFVGALLSIVFLHEKLSSSLLMAGALMGLGLWLHLSERHEHVHTHEPLKHEHAHTHDEHHQHQHTANDPVGEPHTHLHQHEPIVHSHPHYPDIHHRH